MGLLYNFSKNGSIIAEIGRIEGASPPVRRRKVGCSKSKARWNVGDVEVLCIGKPMEILSKETKPPNIPISVPTESFFKKNGK